MSRASSSGRPPSPEELATQVRHGDRRALARAITLVESTRPADQARALALLEALHPHAGGSLRIGVSGAPGVGKSTLIEALGLRIVDAGHRPAVLAVDPSSSLSGGSVLGDKTRMEQLAAREAAFIRPSPAAGARGGVAARTPETIEVCEAAGFDVVVVETVGVGQADADVAGMTDVFVLLDLPFAGDGLQAIKRGATELADVVVYTKADLDAAAAAVACERMNEAFQLLRPVRVSWRPRALAVSALTGDGVDGLWEHLAESRDLAVASGETAARRAQQAVARLTALIDAGLRSSLLRQAGLNERLAALETAVALGRTSSLAAAEEFLDAAVRRLTAPDPAVRPDGD